MGLAIVSGGMDSITLLYEYQPSIDVVLNFMYGSKHNHRETIYAELHARKLGKEFIKIDLDFMSRHFKSNLLQNGDAIPDGHYEDQSMKKTVVPFRNGIMLAIATGLAESKGLNKIYIANHAGDHFIYPDCRPRFINAMYDAITLGTLASIELIAPYTQLDKREIAQRGQRLNVPFEDTWTCYKGLDRHCGLCGSCTERKEALAGFDPTEYLA